jgi:CRP-like cAMP-binding protein
MSQEMFLMVPSGQIVFREGDNGTEMYIIESGSVDIVRALRGSEPIATLGPGDFFGEMAILEDQPRFATAVARAPTKLLRIDRAAFPGVIAGNVEIAIRIMRKLAGRLRRSESRHAESTVPHPTEPPARAPSSVTEFTPMPKAAPPPGRTGTDVAAGNAPIVLLHEATQSRIRLEARAEFLVGRPDPVTATTPEVNLGPYDAQRSLSRRHAKILNDGSAWRVREEVGTLNGTFVNGQRLKPGVATTFAIGDVLRFGSIDMTVTAAQ